MPSWLIQERTDSKVSYLDIEDNFVTYTITLNFRTLEHADALKEAFKKINTVDRGIYFNNEKKQPKNIVISGNIANALQVIEENSLISQAVIDHIKKNEEMLEIINASHNFDIVNVRMQHEVMTYLRDSMKSPQLSLNICRLLSNYNTEKVTETNQYFINIQNYLADETRSAMMKKIIFENMLSDETYLASDPLIHINDIPALLTTVYRHSREGSLVVTLTHFSTFTAKNLKKIFAAAKIVGVMRFVLSLDSDTGIGRELLYSPSMANKFSEIMSEGNFSFDVLKFGCTSSTVGAAIDKTAWVQLISSANFKVLYAGISLDSKKLIPFLAGVSAANALISLELAACDLHLLQPADWISFFETLKAKAIHSLEITLCYSLFKTERLMDAFLTGLTEACITHLKITSWPGLVVLDESQSERIGKVIATNKIVFENIKQDTFATIISISSHPFFRPATLNTANQVPDEKQLKNSFSP